MKRIDRDRIEEMCLLPQNTIRQAMEVIGKGEIATAFIVDAKSRKFIGLITDGDIRRAMLKGAGLETTIDNIERPASQTASIDMKPDAIALMFGEKIRVIPVLDQNGRIVDIALFDQRFRLPVSEPTLAGNELTYVTDCIVSNWISSTGKYVTQFEAMYAAFCEAPFAVATSNGTTALHLALVALGIGPGDEVIVPSLSFIATANAVTYTGAKPVFIDSNPVTWNMDIAHLKKAITPKTKAIIPVHLYGHPADMDPILKLAQEHHLVVIEDAAEAHGALYKGKKVGGIGDVGVFSFYGNKIVTTGEGGMLVCRDAGLAARVKMLRDHGMSPERRYWHPVLGYNYRMTNVQAAIGVAQMERIELILKNKIDVARQYAQGLSGISGLVLPTQEAWAKSVYWLYSILVTDEFGMTRDQLMSVLNGMGIDTRPFFPPMHTQPIYQSVLKLPVCEDLAQRGISLPSSSGLAGHEIERVCEAIRKIQSSSRQDTRI